jgi:hypothetical protein
MDEGRREGSSFEEAEGQRTDSLGIIEFVLAISPGVSLEKVLPFWKFEQASKPIHRGFPQLLGNVYKAWSKRIAPA